MKKILKRINMLSNIILASFIFVLSIPQTISYAMADYKDEQFECGFKGIIKEETNFIQADDNGFDIPNTFYKVLVTNVYKGEVDIDENIIIKYYGGYDSNDNLVLLSGMFLPKINEEYYFNCNRSKSNLGNDLKMKDHCFVVSCPKNMTYEYNPEIEEESQDDVEEPVICKGGFFEDTLYPPSNPNTSFNDAYDIELGDELDINVPNVSQCRYFKFDVEDTGYISFYSENDSAYIQIYDSEQKLIDTDDITTANPRNPRNTTSFLGKSNEEYYLKCGFKNLLTGTYTVNSKHDNYYKSTYNELTTISVVVNNTVHYEMHSKYSNEIYFAMEQWEELDVVMFEQDSLLAIQDISYNDIYDEDASAIAVYNPILHKVEFNDYCFSQMSEEERIKTAIHENGHVLGLGEFTDLEHGDNIMVQGVREQTTLGPADIGVYRQRWGY